MEVTNVIIAIQARSTSKRFPKKVFELIGQKTMLQHVIDSCKESASYIQHNSHRTNVMAKTALLIPFGDEIKEKYSSKIQVLEGPEDDVLARYRLCADRMKADYIVRITSDCPLIPRFLISKLIIAAVKNNYDYIANFHERHRSFPDGWDCEVISLRALKWLDANAKEPSDREHVTTLIRRFPQSEFRLGQFMGYVGNDSGKISVDTPDELEKVRLIQKEYEEAYSYFIEQYGKSHVHRF